VKAAKVIAVYDRDGAPLRENAHMAPPFLSLREQDLASDPVSQFAHWFEQARGSGLSMPEAMGLATATSDGAPSLRMVLLKDFDERGFVFFSNYESRKGLELAANPHAALLFHWDPPGRQVRIEGSVARVSTDETEAYVRSRPRKSQLSALASPQSQAIETRDSLERRVADLEERYGGGELPLPESWGGYRVTAEAVEFWQQREDRLHDRIRYRREGGGWLTERLAP
jgi:pyridoxamine 5'-phosphate oxidase